MILAAGRGERLRPVTEHVPKPLVEVAGKPLIVHALERLASAGFSELVVNLGYRGKAVRRCLGDGSAWGVHIEYSDEGGEPIGTGAGVVRALPLLGKGAFVVVNSDVWTDFPLERLRQAALREVHLVLVPNPAHHPEGDFVLRAGALARTGPGRLTFAGIGVYSPSAFRPGIAGAAALAPYLDRACARGAATGEVHRGSWTDVGTPARLASVRVAAEATPSAASSIPPAAGLQS